MVAAFLVRRHGSAAHAGPHTRVHGPVSAAANQDAHEDTSTSTWQVTTAADQSGARSG
ncbi:MAG: hypothetical protein ACRDS0_07190 [Pseudonocardiaceae bacterium]